MKLHLQSEASECGLACLAMILSHHESHVSLAELRQRFVVSLKGVTLSSLSRYASELEMSSRALRLDLDEMSQLELPCILHWSMDHFVVLKKISSKPTRRPVFIILDPAVGERRLNIEEVSKNFTGVALEITPSKGFEKKKVVDKVGITEFTGPIRGLKRSLIQLIMLAVALELFAIAMPLFNQFVIDEVIQNGDVDLLKLLVIGFFILIVTQTFISLVRGWMLMRWSMDISIQWSQRVFKHLLKLPVSFFEKRHIGDVVSRFGSLSAIQGMLTSVMLDTALDGVMAILALSMMFVYSAQLTLVVLVSLLIYGLLRWTYYAPLRAASAERIVLSAKESTHFLETIRGITPIKLYAREEQRRARWQNLLLDVQNRDVKTQKLTLTARIAHTSTTAVQGLASFYIGAKLVIGNELTVGMLMAFTSYAATFSGRAFGLIDTYVSIKMLGLHRERLADIVHTPVEIVGNDQESDPHFCQSINLKDVRFRYAEGEPWVLDGINLSIAYGESVAITGPSGCGKTTLCKIILGLLVPSSGEILLDGVPLSKIGLKAYRKIVGTVMQDDVLLSGSIMENITFFSDSPDLARMRTAASDAAVSDEIVKMPMGYQSFVGDMGSSLSGGQRQRLLLARAFYKEPQILCLDEATSHLDVENERRILSCLKARNITRVMVAHRPDAIKHADRIIKLISGVVVESNEELTVMAA